VDSTKLKGNASNSRPAHNSQKINNLYCAIAPNVGMLLKCKDLKDCVATTFAVVEKNSHPRPPVRAQLNFQSLEDSVLGIPGRGAPESESEW